MQNHLKNTAVLSDTHKAIALLAASAVIFSVMGLLIQSIGDTTHLFTIVFFRNLIGLFYFAGVASSNSTFDFKTKRLGMHITRAVTGLSAMYLFFFAITQLPLNVAMLFTYSAPVFIPLLAWILLKEPANKKDIAAAMIGFTGIIWILNPSTDQPLWVPIIAFGTAIMAGLAFISLRSLGKTEPARRTVFYFTLISTLISLVPFLLTYEPLSFNQLSILVLIGFLATVSQIAMSKAYGMAPPGRIAPVAFLAIPVSALLSWMVWGDTPNFDQISGSTLVFIGILLTFYPFKARKVS